MTIIFSYIPPLPLRGVLGFWGTALPFREIIETVKNILGSQSELLSVETPKFNQIAQAKNFALNADKLKSLGFEQEVSLLDGLHSICL
jgi:nucleoside-diphosphate-sugar epimerase